MRMFGKKAPEQQLGGGAITAIADSTAYYYAGITNASYDPITITSVDFTF